MAVESDLDRAQYATNGTTGPWTVPFYFLADTDLSVTYTDATGVETTLALTTDYTVSGAGDAGGGSVTTVAAYAAGGFITILRDIAFVQKVVYPEGGPFPAKTHETALDRLTMMAQLLREKVARALTFGAGEVGATTLPSVTDRKGKLLGFDAVSGGLTLITAAANSALDLAVQYASATGSSLMGFLQSGTGATARTLQDKGRERISVSDYANLVFTASAKSPGDANSHVATSFSSWRLAIQAALDEAYARGGGTVVIDGGSAPFAHPTLLIDDYVEIKANTTVIYEAEIVLGDYTTLGSVVHMEGDSIVVHNPRINGSNLFAGASGHNGLSGGTVSNVKVHGGTIRNCARGNTGGMFGGKGFQFEGTFDNVVINGTTLSSCFMALSSNHDFLATSPCGPLVFNAITAENCQILLFVAQTNGRDTSGQAHSVIVNGFRATNCGSFEGLMQFSRASNVFVSNGIISNATSIDSVVRGNHAFCHFENIKLAGDCTALINLDPSTYAQDASYPMESNSYFIKHSGTAGYIANASITTPNRTLANSTIRAQLQNDVTTKIVGDELRNAYCLVMAQQGTTSIEITTANLYLQALTKFASFGAGHNVIASNVGAYSQNASTAPIALSDASGAGLTFTTGYADWCREGRRVTVTFYVTFPATSSSAVAKIGGLPFAASNNSGRISSGLALRFTDYGAGVTGVLNPGDTGFSFATLAGALLTNTNLSGKTVQGVLTYFAA